MGGEVGLGVGEDLEEGGGFFFGGGAAESQFEEVIEAGGVGGEGGVGEEAAGEGLVGLDEDGVVEGDEGLQGGVGAVAADHADLAVAGVEGGERGVGGVAADFGVEGAAVFVGAFADDPVVAAAEGGGEAHVGGHGTDGRASEFGAEEAGDGEGLVAEEFAAGAEAGAAGEEAVFGVAFGEGGWGGGVLAVGGGGDEGFEEVFQVPTGVHQVGGEPVEEFGVNGEVTLGAEVFAGADDAGAEEGFPVAVDGDAGGEGVVFGDEPAGEGEAVAGGVLGERVEGDGGGGVDFGAEVLPFAAILDVAFAVFVGREFRHDGDGGGFDGGEVFFEFGEALAGGCGGFADGAQVVVAEGALVGGGASIGLGAEGDEDGFRGGGDEANARVAAEGEAEVFEGVIFVRGGLFDGDAEGGAGWDGDGGLGEEGEGVRFVGGTGDGPALVFFGGGFEDGGGGEAGLFEVGEGLGEGEADGAGGGVGGAEFGRGLFFEGPDGLFLVVEEDEAIAIETGAGAAVGAVPDADGIDGLGGGEIELPPWIGFLVGVGDAAVGVIAIGAAVDGEGGVGGGVAAALGGFAFAGDVLAGGEDFDFGELQEAFVSGEFEADVAGGGWGCGGGGDEVGGDAGDDEVLSGGFGAELDGGELGIFEGKGDGVGVGLGGLGE